MRLLLVYEMELLFCSHIFWYKNILYCNQHNAELNNVLWQQVKQSFVEFHIFRRIRKISKSNYHLRHVCLSVCPSVRPSVHRSAWKNSASTGQIFYESLYLSIFRKCVEKIKV